MKHSFPVTLHRTTSGGTALDWCDDLLSEEDIEGVVWHGYFDYDYTYGDLLTEDFPRELTPHEISYCIARAEEARSDVELLQHG